MGLSVVFEKRVFKSPDRGIMWLIAMVAVILILVITNGQVRTSDDWLHRAGSYAIAAGFIGVFVLPVALMYPSVVPYPEDWPVRALVSLLAAWRGHKSPAFDARTWPVKVFHTGHIASIRMRAPVSRAFRSEATMTTSKICSPWSRQKLVRATCLLSFEEWGGRCPATASLCPTKPQAVCGEEGGSVVEAGPAQNKG